MRRKVFLACAGGFGLATVLLVAACFLTIGINDAERRSISQTGSFSRPAALVWTPWVATDHTVRPFPGFHPGTRQAAFSEVRRGNASSLLFDFTAYEGRSIPGDSSSAVPAIGPDWGARYHPGWALGAMVLATIFLLAALYI
jgi:hypothetical protein